MTKRLLKIFAWLFIALFAVVVGYQAYINQFRDDSLRKRLPCEPPCWQNIVPGRTASSEAIEIITNSQLVDGQSIVRFGSVDAGGLTWWWRVPGKRLQPKISWAQDVVTEIVFGLTVDVTVQEILSIYGTPPFITIDPGGTPEAWYWIMRLYYPEYGITVYAYTDERSDEIGPTTGIEVAEYYVPVSIDELQHNIVAENSSLERTFFDWEGYGDIELLYFKDSLE